MDSTAFRLTWLSLWKLQRESRLIEPRLNRIIGHGSVHKTAALYAHEHEVSAPGHDTFPEHINENQPGGIVIGDKSRANIAEASQLQAEQPGFQYSVVVREIELDEAGLQDPLSDKEENLF